MYIYRLKIKWGFDNNNKKTHELNAISREVGD
jgi:hypothetical protein